MRKSLGLGLTAAAVIAAAMTPAAGWAAVTSTALPTSTLSNAPAAGDPNTTITFAVTTGLLSMTAPATATLATGSGVPGTTISGPVGPVTVTDDRALLAAAWAATASSTDFTTGTATANEIIPAGDATYTPGTITHTGTLTTTGTTITLANPVAGPAVDPTVVAGTAGVGNNTATWDPTVAVAIPAAAIGGTYTGTLTQSVS